MCYGDYDTSIQVIHSHRLNFKVTFEREVEPGIIKILDMDLREIPVGNSSIRRKCLRMVSIRDGEFLIDQTTFDEIVEADNYMEELIRSP